MSCIGQVSVKSFDLPPLIFILHLDLASKCQTKGSIFVYCLSVPSARPVNFCFFFGTNGRRLNISPCLKEPHVLGEHGRSLQERHSLYVGTRSLAVNRSYRKWPRIGHIYSNPHHYSWQPTAWNLYCCKLCSQHAGTQNARLMGASARSVKASVLFLYQSDEHSTWY